MNEVKYETLPTGARVRTTTLQRWEAEARAYATTPKGSAPKRRSRKNSRKRRKERAAARNERKVAVIGPLISG